MTRMFRQSILRLPTIFEKASEAVLEMRRQTETDIFKDGLMQRGLIIRHLVLPGNTAQSVKILKWISEKLPCDTFVSIMSQYTPCGEAFKYKDLRRKNRIRRIRQGHKHIF